MNGMNNNKIGLADIRFALLPYICVAYIIEISGSSDPSVRTADLILHLDKEFLMHSQNPNHYLNATDASRKV